MQSRDTFRWLVSVFLLVASDGGLGAVRTPLRTRRDEPFVFPDTNDGYSYKKEIPLDMIRRINEVGSESDFFETFVESDPTPLAITAITARIGGDGPVERKGLLSAKMAVCMPELQTVALRPEKDKGTYYYPSCTRVERCGGCCSHELLSCQPVASEILQFNVIVTEYRGGSQLKLRGKEIVEVERHTKCKCDCKIKPEDCKAFQKYSKESCRCVCANKDKEQKCLEERASKLWNPNECACVCKDEEECTTGFYFDRFQCICKPVRASRRNTTLASDFDRLNYNIENNS